VTTTTKTNAAFGRSGSPSTNGHGSPGRSAVAPPNRRVRVPELAIGVLVLVAFALGALLWHLSTTSKSAALVLASGVSRGEVVEATDLRTAYISTDEQLVRVTDPASVVGKVALNDLSAGTLMTPAAVADASVLEPGDGVVGLALDPGQYPALGLAPGDRVNVVRSGDAPVDPNGADVNQVLARGATVFEVEELASDRKLVSIRSSEADAETVAAAAGSGALRLVLVAS